MAKRKDDSLQVPFGADKVLLHTCCAPCSGAIIERLLKEGVRPLIYYCNPNIYPYEEYLIRKEECSRYASSLGLEIVDADYGHQQWLEAVKGLESEPERGGRCFQCFKYRLLRAAEYASGHGYRVLTTTLASSRWKSLDQINQAGQWACTKVSGQAPDMAPVWWEQNWRKGGLQERRSQIIREQNFYNQQYCGCEFSMRRDNSDACPESGLCEKLPQNLQ